MKSKLANFNISRFEVISEQIDGLLLGGFSASYSNQSESALDSEGGERNNCMGGNCQTGCGEGQNKDCNTIAHCGA
ncbi:hypothetical protein GCM10022289_31650 [Pedobacter jeongneungensis]|uniref:Natural product n=1 Tax=Pedobacter jeongneungensis TaxID=947309 RepID=A0ABP8BJ21_9SPHI